VGVDGELYTAEPLRNIRPKLGEAQDVMAFVKVTLLVKVSVLMFVKVELAPNVGLTVKEMLPETELLNVTPEPMIGIPPSFVTKAPLKVAPETIVPITLVTGPLNIPPVISPGVLRLKFIVPELTANKKLPPADEVHVAVGSARTPVTRPLPSFQGAIRPDQLVLTPVVKVNALATTPVVTVCII
jgi:hypothetical protein